ncbi:MAG: fibronectin type III domain-containing protein [Verrucomicrobia bacterium]|nr:fibronectin type III domain-containing protein [Verrucomicrobiota bacterium]
MAGATAGELFIVARLKDFANYYNGLAHFGTGYGTIYQPSGLWNDFGTADLEFYPRSTDATFTSPHLLNTSISTSGDSTLRLHAAETITLTGQTVSFRTDPSLGIDRYSEAFNGDIAEVLVFDRVLTPAERTVVQTYLATKYGITAAIPNTATAPKLSAVSATATSVALSWTGEPPVTTDIERRVGNGPFVPVASITSEKSYTDTGLTAGLTYSYRVRAGNGSGISDYSSVETITLVSQSTIPGAGLRLWLRADAGVVADTDGFVTAWADQSGRQKDATQTNSPARPAVVANAANGKPALRFDGSGRYLDLPAVMSAATEGELFVVVRVPEFASRDDGLWTLGGVDGAKTGLQGTGRGLFDDFGRSVAAALGSPVKSLSEYVVYNVSAKPGDWTMRLNGILQYSDSNPAVLFGPANFVGRSSDKYLQGDIAEIIVHGRVLGAAERQTVKKYLAQKYAVNLNLPGTPTDADGDGMPDAWELLNGTDPLFNDADYDLDGDGFSNLAEYSQGSSPAVLTAPDTARQVTLRVIWP